MMPIFTVRIHCIISVISVILSPIKIGRSGIVVWILSHLHATVNWHVFWLLHLPVQTTACERLYCQEFLKPVVPMLWFMSHQRIDGSSLECRGPDFPPCPPCFHLLFQESVLFFWELSFSVSFPIKALATEKLHKKRLWTSLSVRIWSQFSWEGFSL